MTKNGEIYGRALHDRAVMELANLPQREGSLFGYVSRWQVYRDWDAAKAAVGLDDFTPHDCRHTYATWLRKYSGVDLKQLMEMGGWKDVKSVLRYAHVSSDEQRDAIDRLPIGGKSVESPKRRKRNA